MDVEYVLNHDGHSFRRGYTLEITYKITDADPDENKLTVCAHNGITIYGSTLAELSASLRQLHKLELTETKQEELM